MLWISLWVTERELWIEACCCGQVTPEVHLSRQVERGPRRPSGGRARARGQIAAISTGMPFSTDVPDNGSIASWSASTLLFTPARSRATRMRVSGIE